MTSKSHSKTMKTDGMWSKILFYKLQKGRMMRDIAAHSLSRLYHHLSARCPTNVLLAWLSAGQILTCTPVRLCLRCCATVCEMSCLTGLFQSLIRDETPQQAKCSAWISFRLDSSHQHALVQLMLARLWQEWSHWRMRSDDSRRRYPVWHSFISILIFLYTRRKAFCPSLLQHYDDVPKYHTLPNYSSTPYNQKDSIHSLSFSVNTILLRPWTRRWHMSLTITFYRLIILWPLPNTIISLVLHNQSGMLFP